MGLFAAVGDPTAHGSQLFPGIGSTDVIIGGMPVWRTMDQVIEIPGGPNPIVVGCPAVIIGP